MEEQMHISITISDDLSIDEKQFFKGTRALRKTDTDTGRVVEESFITPDWKKKGETIFDENGEKAGYTVFGWWTTKTVFVVKRELNDKEKEIFPNGDHVRVYGDANEEMMLTEVIFDKDGHKLGEDVFELNGKKSGYTDGKKIFYLDDMEFRTKLIAPIKPAKDPFWNELTPEQRKAFFDGKITVELTPEQRKDLQPQFEGELVEGSYVENLRLTSYELLTVHQPNGAQIPKKADYQPPVLKKGTRPWEIIGPMQGPWRGPQGEKLR